MTNEQTDLDRLPKRLSPSRANDFVNCPKAFYYKTIERRPTRNTVVNTRGTLAHDALEELFQLPREERTVPRAQSFVEPAWEKIRNRDSYKNMVEPGSREEQEMFEYAREMVANYFKIENPQAFDAGRLEYHAQADLGDLTIRGYIDRLDKVPVNGEEKYFVTDYKALALNTVLPTPTGYTTIAAVQVGDLVLGTDGGAYPVEGKSEVFPGRPCYDITVGGTQITADEDHLWLVQYDEGTTEAVVTTATLLKLLQDGRNPRVPATAAPQLGHRHDLRVPPRMLGEWLGTGCPDGDLADRIPEDMRKELQGTPRIPTPYLRASETQRFVLYEELVSRMQDPASAPGCVVSESADLIEDLRELAATLGMSSASGRTPHECTVFRPDFGDKWVTHAVEAVTRTASQDTQCIKVGSPDRLFLVSRNHIPTHNTGKIPSDRFLDDAFFAMRIYALLVYEETGEMPYMLRLIYLRGENAEEAVRRVIVTPQLLERARRDIENIWKRIRTAAATRNWPTKKGPLCGWCDFKPICPAWQDKE